MDAVIYVKAWKRMCKTFSACDKCLLHVKEGCMAEIPEEAEMAVSIVKQWAKDHPIKTRQSEFLKTFPNAQMVNIEHAFCIAHFDSTKMCKESNPSGEKCIACRYRFWNEEVTDND